MILLSVKVVYCVLQDASLMNSIYQRCAGITNNSFLTKIQFRLEYPDCTFYSNRSADICRNLRDLSQNINYAVCVIVNALMNARASLRTPHCTLFWTGGVSHLTITIVNGLMKRWESA